MEHSDHVYKCKEQELDADPISLAIIYAFNGAGLATLALRSPEEHSEKMKLAYEWLDLASTCLQIGKFLERPSLEGK